MKKVSPAPEMESTLPTSDAQEPILFDDLAIYFSQEECVSVDPAQKSLTREATQECSNNVTLMATGDWFQDTALFKDTGYQNLQMLSPSYKTAYYLHMI
ncbi:zinc finger protein 597 isoform X2 [Fukomys damarensis]|uniref:zinc finger protein 597 isoform X2 n=1 Tax=Fukomys damarensis TaxID=885580 RepID=UPI00053F623F|nr:zinc finger protein 597 isoform X2 [Fukomys damarensis]